MWVRILFKGNVKALHSIERCRVWALLLKGECRDSIFCRDMSGLGFSS